MKKALLIRLGAFGDLVACTPILPFLKRDGYEVHFNCKGYSADVLKHNPYIDKIILHDDSIPNEKLEEHWAELGKGYDKVINLSGSIEDGLLVPEYKPEFHLPHEERHARYNVNYYDRTMELAGYPVKGLTGELYFSPAEETQARDIRRKYHNSFLVLWSLSGSSYHKSYPWAEPVAKAFLNTHPNAVIFTVGDDLCKMLEWSHRQTKNYSGIWNIRKSMIMTKYADLVIAPETGILNAAGCFETPKIALLSHSSEENLTKHFKNCTSLRADVPCQPCHRLIYTRAACPLDDATGTAVCMSKLKAVDVFNAMQSYYQKWRDSYGALRRVS